MHDLTLLLDDRDLRARFGAPTVDRARDYVRRGKVLACSHELDADGDLDIRGNVEGSLGEVYSCHVSVGRSGPGTWAYGRCSCPVGDGCKHTVALLLTVRARQEAEAAAHGGTARRWERELASVLDELDGSQGRAGAPTRPLALQVELDQRSTSAARRRWQSHQPAGRGGLRLRPLQRGARDNWVRSGISWQDLPSLERRRSGYLPAQAAVLNELYAAHRAASRHGYYGAESHLTLSSFGGSLWSLLDRCVREGVELVPGAGLDAVHLRSEPVGVELDVNADADAGTHLRLGVRAEGEWYSSDAVDVLGDSGHGVVLWREGERPGAWAVTLTPLARPAGPEVRRLLASADELVVPADHHSDLLTEYLPRLQRHVTVSSSDGSVALPEPAPPRLVLTIEWVAADEVALSWSWRYLVGEDDRVYALHETRGLRGVRKPAEEAALLERLDGELDDEQVHRLYGSHRRDGGLIVSQTLRHGAALGFAEDVLPGLEKLDWLELEEIGTRPDYREAAGAPVIRFGASTDGEGESTEGRTDWLDLEVEISVDGHFLALAHVLEALTWGMNRVIMRNGVHVRIDRPEFHQLAELVTAAGELHERPKDGSVRVGTRDLGLWDELAEVGIVEGQAQQWVKAARALRDLESAPAVAPTGIEARLRGYQLDGFRWLVQLWSTGLGGILADDMGLGKTLQTLALISHARSQGAGPFLVIAPSSVVSTWAREAATFTPTLAVEVVTESHARRATSISELSERADLVITSYTLYRLEVEAYTACDWGGLVLDEAQMVKNHNGKTYQCVRRLDVPFRLALTGTPMENRLMDLWSLLSIVASGLYPYPRRFAELVATPVERLGDTAALERFRRRIRPFLLRRTKELVARDLPPKQEQVIEVTLTPKHRRIYQTHLQRERQTVLGLVEDFDKHRIAIFRSLTRLRQLSLDAGLVDEEYTSVASAKVDVLVDHLVELVAEGHRALVFSSFTSFLRRVRARLDREQISTSYLDGSTRRRGEVVEEFRSGDAGVFLISLKAGGVGLTLTEADYVFVLDPWWNPAVEAQAVDRAHRIGQARPVMVYRLVARDTIEEKVMALKARKAALFAQVVDAGTGGGGGIDADDVRALLEE